LAAGSTRRLGLAGAALKEARVTKQPNKPTPDEQIAAATAAVAALERDRAAYLTKRQADDPLRKFDDAIAAQQAELKAGEAAKRATAARELALKLREEVAGFVEEAVDLQSALADAAESGAGMKARLSKIHELQGAINVTLGRPGETAPVFPTAEQLGVQTDIGFRSILQDTVFGKHVERLSPVDKREIAGIAAGYGQRIELNWIAPFLGEQTTNEEAA
jgi:hypothetical protein